MPLSLRDLATRPAASGRDVSGLLTSRSPNVSLTALGQVSRSLVDDYDRFRGIADDLTDTARGVGGEEAVDLAQARTGRNFDMAEGTYGRQIRGLGVPVTERQASSNQRRFNLARALAEVDSGNRTRAGVLDRSRTAARAGSGFVDAIDGVTLSALGGTAAAEGGRNIDYLNRRAQAEAGRNAALGRTIGLAGSIFGMAG